MNFCWQCGRKQEGNENLSDITQDLNIPIHNDLSEYIERDKSKDVNGHIVHVSDFMDRNANNILNKYWTDFFRTLSSNFYRNRYGVNEKHEFDLKHHYTNRIHISLFWDPLMHLLIKVLLYVLLFKKSVSFVK